MTPRRETIAFMMWQFTKAHGWNVTPDDVVRHFEEIEPRLMVTRRDIYAVTRARGWLGLLRRAYVPRGNLPSYRLVIRALEEREAVHELSLLDANDMIHELTGAA